jgi:hypothetical protein
MGGGYGYCFVYYCFIADMVGEEQHQFGVDLHALRIGFAVMQVDEFLVEIISLIEIGVGIKHMRALGRRMLL